MMTAFNSCLVRTNKRFQFNERSMYSAFSVASACSMLLIITRKLCLFETKEKKTRKKEEKKTPTTMQPNKTKTPQTKRTRQPHQYNKLVRVCEHSARKVDNKHTRKTLLAAQ